jgi:hypothetical protein
MTDPNTANPLAGTLQSLSDEFHMMMGYCIAEWAAVDQELFKIFHLCVGRLTPSAIVYYRMSGLNPRMDATDEIVKSMLQPEPKKSGAHDSPDVEAWKAALGDGRRLLEDRRRIAHHPTGMRFKGANFDFASDPNLVRLKLQELTGFEIYVSYTERRRPKSAKLSALGIDDLKSHLVAVTALRDRLNHFFNDVLLNRPELFPPPAFPPQSKKSQSEDTSTAAPPPLR